MENYFFGPGIGEPVDRIESKAKVTGSAKYAAEYKREGLTYGVLVTSSIAKGRIRNLDTKKAERSAGVITIISHLNRPDVPGWNKPAGSAGGESRVEGKEFHVFFDDRIYFDHQPVALVIADTLERATNAADLVKVSYQQEPSETDFSRNTEKAFKPKRTKDYSRGNIDAWQTAPVKVDAVYSTPFQVHNPMEMHAMTVIWENNEKVILYNKSQAVKIAQKDVVTAFELKEENVLVISPFVGGAFGSASRIWPGEMAAILGAKKTGKPLTVMAKRDQVFNMVGYRPQSLQHIVLGAGPDGVIAGITHEATGTTSMYEEFTERITEATRSQYASPNVNTTYKLVSLDMSTPCWTRGPGETSGSFAMESAMDELSYALKMDPLQLRLKNFAETDAEKNLPWSSNYLKECYRLGAEKFGWNKRNPAPRSMKAGDWLLGMGMSAGVYGANRSPASASANFRSNGTLLVQTSVADTGPGSATIMAQIAADAFGIELSKVIFEWGNSTFPLAPGQFGSHTTASTGSAVHDVAKSLQQRFKDLAVNSPGSPFAGKRTDDLIFQKGIFSTQNVDAQLSYEAILKLLDLPELKETKESKSGPENEKFSGKSFAAHFVEVLVHPATGVIKMNRVVTVIDAGKIVNHKTAESQAYGSIVWGLGISLMEEGIVDHRYGRYVNNNLADYHEPVNADIPPIEVIFIDKPDPVLDPMGAKGLGEIGLIGFTAAVANAVYHATGKRIRNLPITVDKLI